MSLLQQHDIAFQANLYESKNPTRRWLHTRRREWILDAVRKYAPRNGSFLEIGIGCGIYTRELARIGQVSAFDINQQFVTDVNVIPNVSASVGDIQTLELDPVYDLAICSEVIEHIPDSVTALKNIWNSLKPGAMLILTTPNKYSSVELVARLLGISAVASIVQKIYKEPVDDLGHINRLTQSGLRRQITAAGFDVLEHENLAFYMPGIGEFGGSPGLSLCQLLERIIRPVPVLSWLLWTQCWVLRKPDTV